MNSDYSTSSGFVRVLAVLAASVLTGTLFAAVMLGLTGSDGWSLFAHYDDRAAPAAVVPA